MQATSQPGCRARAELSSPGPWVWSGSRTNEVVGSRLRPSPRTRPPKTAARGTDPSTDIAPPMELDGDLSSGARRTMSDVLETLSAPTAAEPAGVRSHRRIPARGIASALFLLLLGWWLFIADTAANNDVIEGLDVLITGIGEPAGVGRQSRRLLELVDVDDRG